MNGFIDLVPQAEPPRPRESALGILFRRGPAGGLEVLFGRRSRRSRFMPGHLAFPGGRLEQTDEPTRAGAHARCTAREVEEEVGLAIPETRWLAAGERTTPPMFPVRFRTLFFVAELEPGDELPPEPPRPEEIDLLRLVSPAAVLEEWRQGRTRLPPPCLPILRALAEDGMDGSPEAIAGRLGEINRREDRLPQIEFQPDVWVLPVRTRTVPPATHTNVWMPGGERFVLIDPGSDRPEELDRLAELVDRRRASGAEPDSILLTHHHPDHVSGLAALAPRLGLPVRAHAATLAALAPARGVETRELADGDTIDLGGLTLRALHTPGHAKGHLAFEVSERDALIAGDLVSGFSTILIHPDEGDMGTYLDSLRRARDAGRGVVLPAHGPPLPAKVWDKVIGHRLERERRVLDATGEESRSLDELSRRAYADAPDLPPVLRQSQTLAHLLHLERRGSVRRGDDPSSWRRAGEGAG